MVDRDDPETCDDCGAIVGGNPDCGACRDWVYRDARRPTSPENDERDPTVPAGTSPLPYVEVGMRVVHPDDGAKWWEVESIHADDSFGLRDHTVCALRSNDARRLSDVPCEDVRTWRLAEDFDPNEPYEPVPAYADRTEERIRERHNDREYPRSVEEDVAFLLGELDSARLGCEIAYRREPTREEMRAALAGSRDGEAFIAMGGWTVRRCRVCSEPVAGGPTACVLCVERETIADLRAKLARAEADYAEIAHVVGIEHAVDGCMPEPGPLDVVLRAIRETRAKADRVIEAEVARDEALAAKAKAEADAAAALCVLREQAWHAAGCERLALESAECHCNNPPLAAVEAGTAGAALLRELVAGRALAAYARNVRLMLPYVPENDRAVYEALETALADYDAARGAR